MAIRSGGGTGVLVALVVFVLLFVFTTVMTIVFYVGKNEAMQRANTAEADLGAFITPGQQQAEESKQLKASAATDKKSLYGYLMDQRAETAAWAAGNRSADLSALQTELGVPKEKTVKDTLADVRRQLKAKSDESNALNTTVNDLKKLVASAKEEAETARKDGDAKVDAVRQEISGYGTAATELEEKVRGAIATLDAERARLNERFNSQKNEMQAEIDSLRADASIKDSRVRALEDKVKAIEVKPANPAELVDGRIIAIEGSGDQVFINIGKRDRVVPGMTFEVYDDANAIQASDRSGQNRGKASLQVMRVADSTSTCKITRQATGRPVVKDDVIANAVFNPDYKFKFLVHGKFDIDGDGKPSDNEADYLKSQIRAWGGEVIDGEALSGDLDFLVLGMKPMAPPPPPPDATETQIEALLAARNAAETYDRLFFQASNARIPVLNWNRFQILTGGTTSR
ncbi:MAG: hypothetical protein SGJ09_17225 [Phycisphaerae bacterium]|nr:hypothetical protein [Phycisphaerae bacterium]